MEIPNCFGMKFASTNLVLILLLIGMQYGLSQSSFTNLDFESAKIVLDQSSPYYPYAVNAAKALLGWTVLGGAPGGGDIIYNTVSLGAAAVSIHDTNGFEEPILQGRFSVLLQGQFSGMSNTAAIAQTGLIPATAQSLTFFGVLGSFQTTFKGQVIPLTAIGSGANYTIYGGDVSLFAGQVGELRFTALSPGEALIDNIQFSSASIPEPSGFALFTAGALLLGFSRRPNSSR
jgi:hypothetical protein